MILWEWKKKSCSTSKAVRDTSRWFAIIWDALIQTMLNIVQHKKVIHQNQGSNDPKGHQVDLSRATRAHPRCLICWWRYPYKFSMWKLHGCEWESRVTGSGRTLARCQGWTSHEIDFRVNFRGFVFGVFNLNFVTKQPRETRVTRVKINSFLIREACMTWEDYDNRVAIG